MPSRSLLLWVGLLLGLTACEKTVDLDLPAGAPKLVVEGHIEPGLPPVVVLTETQPVFAGIDSASLAQSLVHGAVVTVQTRDSTFRLREVRADSLPAPLVKLLAEQIGLKLTAAGRLPIPLSFYTTLPGPGQPALTGRPGRTYRLRVEARGQVLTATTSVPWPVPLDTLWFRPPGNPDLADSLVVLWYRFTDPDTVGNATRYFTKVNSEPFYTARTQTVFTDEFVNGRTVDYPLERGRRRGVSYDAARGGLFRKGDTVTVRWCAIDQPHFRFWLSVDNALAANGSPLAAPAQLSTNIRGGLGIWGGYGTTYKTIVAPR